jgi:xanthine dehydrogenase accessory factor
MAHESATGPATMAEWLDKLLDCRRSRVDGVLVSVASVKGSAPRDVGAKMVVTADGAYDSIGGGDLELRAIDTARGMLTAPRERQVRHFPLGADLGQVCGGRVDLVFELVPGDAAWTGILAERVAAGSDVVVATRLSPAPHGEGKLLVWRDGHAGTLGDSALDAFALAAGAQTLSSGGATRLAAPPDDAPAFGAILLDPVRAPDFHVVLFGAGHVGTALVDLLQRLPCRVTWVDGRPGRLPAQPPANVLTVSTEHPADVAEAVPPGAYFLVMTHSHDLDRELAERILRRADFRYFGVMGSATKRRQFERHLAALGFPAERIARMTCPVGVPGIRGKHPPVIAVSVAAQLLQWHDDAISGSAPATPAIA